MSVGKLLLCMLGMLLPWIANRANSLMNNQWGWVTIMVQLNTLVCLHFPMVATTINKGACLLMWPAALCSGLAEVSMWLGRTWKKSSNTYKNTLKRLSTLLNVMVVYLCVQSFPGWAWMFMSVVKRQRTILEDGYHHTVIWQRYCRKLTFQACRPCPI